MKATRIVCKVAGKKNRTKDQGNKRIKRSSVEGHCGKKPEADP